jgi:DNA-binding NarL/FixJ family response regulator
MSRVVIVEPVRLFRDSLVASLSAQWPDRRIDGFSEISSVHVCADCTGGELLLISASELDRSVQSLVKRGLSVLPDAVPVVLLDHFDQNRAAEAVAVGVRGFVPKSAPIGVLTGALDMVLDGEVYFPSPSMGEAHSGFKDDGIVHGRVRHISPRQHEVLELMVAGMSNAGIAEQLGIKESTVKNHVQGIFRTFNVASRTQAVVAAVRAGLEPPPLPARHEFP